MGPRHRKREVLLVGLREFVVDYVHKIILFDIILVEVLRIKIIVAQHDAIWFVFENYVEYIMQLVLPVLAELRHVQGLEVARGYVEWIQFINIVGALDHTQIELVGLLTLLELVTYLDKELSD